MTRSTPTQGEAVRRQVGAMLVAMVSTDLRDEREFNDWYDNEHIQERLACPGFIGARRYRLVEGDSPSYLTLYELTDVGALSTPEYLGLAAAGSDRTKAMTSHIIERVRIVYEALTNE